ncbi:hypothetical protein [Methylophilus sp. 5]|uniref:hypothetical protein n=1 Tax=Methylophilus sp. 5 TaxID=1112274 RepID=UPI0004B87374|nr:hypothetical protein [Methylophilus sp. 5]
MQLPNWAKILWWSILVGVLTYFLRERLPDLLTGKAAAADIAAFGVWMALLLAPLFNEVTLLGVTLKNQIEELKDHIATQIADVRADVRNAVDVRATVSPTFNLPGPPSDAQLPAIEAQVKAAVAAALAEHGSSTPVSTDFVVSDDVAYLFATRYHIESELRRLASDREIGATIRRVPPTHLLSRSLVESGLLSPRLGNAIREVYSVCSPAIHGEPVTAAQVSFVRDVGPELIAALRSIE